MRLRVLAVVVAFSSSVLSASPAEAASAARPHDFNGDGYPELVVGAPELRVGSVAGAGGVVVLPASARGLSLTERIISQSSRGVPGASEGGDWFGDALASADFDLDGYADLAVGQRGESVGALPSSGAVTVIYGSSRGLDTTRSSRLNPTAHTGSSPDFGEFGTSLVAGDFNRDRFPDLAIGAPYVDAEGIPGEENARESGTVVVVSGGPTGLSTAVPTIVRRQGGRVPDAGFGTELAAGDIDGDGGTDLIVHSIGDGDEDQGYPGSISYCPGRVGGPTGCTRLAHDLAYAGARALAVGNLSGDSRSEIVVGSPSSGSGHGAVRILKLGAGTPLTVAGRVNLNQVRAGVPGSNESDDRFGSGVALGDIDRDGFADLVIGAVGENRSKGRVTVVHGAVTGWRTSGTYLFSQNTPGIPGVAEVGDRFGSDVTLLDHNRDGRLDLTVGAAGENGAGAITTLRGSGHGFTTTGARTFGLATLGYPDPAGAEFGVTLGNKSAAPAG
jgi:hypothetical protein